MFRPHDGAPATLLLDGTVLMAGGGIAGDSAELYVPAGVTPPAGLPAGPAPTDSRLTGAWIATGSMNTPRFGHTAVRLLDGRVLVAGGSNEAEEHMTSAELYDPKSGTWSATADMLKPHYRYGFPATLLLRWQGARGRRRRPRRRGPEHRRRGVRPSDRDLDRHRSDALQEGFRLLRDRHASPRRQSARDGSSRAPSCSTPTR